TAVGRRGERFTDRVAVVVGQIDRNAVLPDHARAVTVFLVVPTEDRAPVAADAVRARVRVGTVHGKARHAFGGRPAERDRVVGLVVGEANCDAVVGNAVAGADALAGAATGAGIGADDFRPVEELAVRVPERGDR